MAVTGGQARLTRSNITPAQLAAIAADYQRGATLATLATTHDSNRNTIRRLLVDAGVAMRPRSRTTAATEAASRGRPPGRPRSPHTDDRILDTATRMFGAHGYDRVAVETIAAAAGVGLNSIYRRYPGKDTLGCAVLRHCWTRFAAAVLDDLPDVPPAVLLTVYWSRLVDLHRVDPAVARHVDQTTPSHPVDRATARHIHAGRQRRDEVLHSIADGRMEPSVVEALIHGTVTYLVGLPMPPRRRARLARAAGAVVWQAIAAHSKGLP